MKTITPITIREKKTFKILKELVDFLDRYPHPYETDISVIIMNAEKVIKRFENVEKHFNKKAK